MFYIVTLLKRRPTGDRPPRVQTNGAADRQNKILRYGIELDHLHDDLGQILKRITGLPKVQKTRNLSRIRWGLRYHVYNFHVRVSAYREKLYELLQFLFPPKPASSPKKPQPASKRQVILSALEHQGFSRLADVIRSFERDEIISVSLKQRNAFVHSLVLDWDKWPSIGPSGWLREAIEQAMAEDGGEEGRVKRAQNQAESAMHLSGYKKEKQEELRRILHRLAKLRDEICAELACR